MDSGDHPSRSEEIDYIEFVQDYWDIFFGLAFGLLAYFLVHVSAPADDGNGRNPLGCDGYDG